MHPISVTVLVQLKCVHKKISMELGRMSPYSHFSKKGDHLVCMYKIYIKIPPQVHSKPRVLSTYMMENLV
jgi:hypothetical protein